jgi:hypothetical protein
MNSRRLTATSEAAIVSLRLVPQKGGMSALGHKRTYAVQTGMSALPPKADMSGTTCDVRFVPIADIPPFKRRPLVYTGSMTY